MLLSCEECANGRYTKEMRKLFPLEIRLISLENISLENVPVNILHSYVNYVNLS